MIVEKSNELFDHYQIINNIEKIEILNDFEIRVLKSSLLSLGQIYNPLHYANFSLNLREIFNQFIDRKSNKELIKKASWYKKPEKAKSGITTNQKYKYFILGNTPIDFHEALVEMGIDIDIEIEKLTTQQKKLNKYTHFNEKSLDFTWKEAKQSSLNLLQEFLNFLGLEKQINTSIQENITESIRSEIEDFFLSNSVEQLDEIATHYFTPEPEIDNIECEFDEENLYININGNVHADFQVGSNSDLKHDMGVEFSKSFPFEASLYSKLNDIKTIRTDHENWLFVDTAGYYENYYD